MQIKNYLPQERSKKAKRYPVVRISCKDNEFSEFNIYTFARHLTGGQFDNGGPLVVDCICTKEYYYYVPAYLAKLQCMEAACPPFTQEVLIPTRRLQQPKLVAKYTGIRVYKHDIK